MPIVPARLRAGLGAMYGWFEPNAALVREITEKRVGPVFAAWNAALGDDDSGPAEAAMLDLALSFHTWRSLALGSGLGSAAAAQTMAAAIFATAGRSGP